MEKKELENIFTRDFLNELLPLDLSDLFFEALYGDASEGAYDIKLEFESADSKQITLCFKLIRRPDKCLVCSLTYGLPKVFACHPLINIKNMVKKIKNKGIKIKNWKFGNTQENNSLMHSIPLYLELE